MLKVYAADWCPHCRYTIQWLKEHNIDFEYYDIEQVETQNGELIRKIIEVNGGDDWVVPTLEFDGQWRPGKVFSAAILEQDLKKIGIL